MDILLPLWFHLSFVLFFLAYSQPSQTGCLLYFHTWCGLGANLERKSEMCCTRLAGNTGCKKSRKIRHLLTIAQRCRAISPKIETKAHIDNRQKLVKQQYLLHMSSQYGELWPTNSWDRLATLGHPLQISTGFASWLCHCTHIAQQRSTKLCTIFDRLLGWYTIHILAGALAA